MRGVTDQHTGGPYYQNASNHTSADFRPKNADFSLSLRQKIQDLKKQMVEQQKLFQKDLQDAMKLMNQQG